MNLPVTDAIYGRVSTDHQDLSLEAQERRVTRYCDAQEFDVPDDRRFYDDDVSGDTPVDERPAGRKLMLLIRTGRIRRLAVATITRLSRDTLNGLLFERDLRHYGTTLHIVDMGGCSLDLGTPYGRFFFTMALAGGELELNNIRTQTRKVAEHLRDTGRVSGEIPYGWRAVDAYGKPAERLELRTTDPATGQEKFSRPWPDGTQLVLDEHQAEVIRYMVARQAEGWSFNRIAQDLNHKLEAAKNGGEWQTGNVKSVLQSKHTAKLLALP